MGEVRRVRCERCLSGVTRTVPCAARGKTNNRFFNDALAQALYVGAARDTATCREGFGDTGDDAPAGTAGGGHHRRDAGSKHARGGGHRARRAEVICGAGHTQGGGANHREAISAGGADPRGRYFGAARGDGTDQRADRGRSHDCLHCVRPDGASASLESAGAVTLPRHGVFKSVGLAGPVSTSAQWDSFSVCDDGHKIQIKLLEKRNDSCPP